MEGIEGNQSCWDVHLEAALLVRNECLHEQRQAVRPVVVALQVQVLQRGAGREVRREALLGIVGDEVPEAEFELRGRLPLEEAVNDGAVVDVLPRGDSVSAVLCRRASHGIMGP